MHSSSPNPPLWRTEKTLVFAACTALAFLVAGRTLLSPAAGSGGMVLTFLWLFVAVIAAACAVARHAEGVAHWLGEPLGTLVLTLSVIAIEVTTITSVMMTGDNNPTLARDSMFAAMMIVLNGLIGLSLLLGGVRHEEQQYNLQGANAYLGVITPLSVIALVLPNYTRATPDGSFSRMQSITLIGMSLGLYLVFLAIQSIRHRGYFELPPDEEPGNAPASNVGADDGHRAVVRSPGIHAVLLILYLVCALTLSKKVAVPINSAIETFGVPVAFGGFLVACIVLSPEGLGAVRAALANHLQRAVNIFLGSVLATIGLTVPAVLCVGLVMGRHVVLGLDRPESLMLMLTLVTATVTFSSRRTNILQGAVHLLLFFVYIVLIFDR